MGEKLSKYIYTFEYFDKTLNTKKSGGISTISFTSVTGVPEGIASASCSLAFSLTTGIIKKLLKIRNKRKKHNKIVMLAKTKLSSIETLISGALIDLEISSEEFKTMVNEREKYEIMKESIMN